jgi:hypothetical protein
MWSKQDEKHAARSGRALFTIDGVACIVLITSSNRSLLFTRRSSPGRISFLDRKSNGDPFGFFVTCHMQVAISDREVPITPNAAIEKCSEGPSIFNASTDCCLLLHAPKVPAASRQQDPIADDPSDIDSCHARPRSKGSQHMIEGCRRRSTTGVLGS